MITSTIVKNGRTIRTWEESRNNGKTFVRKFYLRYRVNAVCNGVHYTIAMCETKQEAIEQMNTTKEKVNKKYHPTSWINTSKYTPLTHIYDLGYWVTLGVKGKSISLYITEEGANQTICEEIK